MSKPATIASPEALLQHFVCTDISEWTTPYERGAWRHWLVSEQPPISAFDALDGQASAEEHAHSAARYRANVGQSYDDTDAADGFLSRWADSLSRQEASAKAELARNGGYALFPALYTQDGKSVRAKLLDGQYGPYWAFLGEYGQFTGEFLNAGCTKRSKLVKRGYVVVSEWRRAKVVLQGRGTGLSGQAWVATVETDQPAQSGDNDRLSVSWGEES